MMFALLRTTLESPTWSLGAWLGVWLNGMKSQFTYFQQVGGIEVDPVQLKDYLWS